jgi:ADP-ribosyl-[dinitrogen reductase] hydrolase
LDVVADVTSKHRGAFLGLAIGDALGAAVEFHPPGMFVPVTGYRGDGPHGLRAGEWTDDTSMALALADSLASCGWDLHDQMRRYLRWRDEGAYSAIGRCFDIGVTTNYALQQFKRGVDPRSAADPDEYASGNGSLMRLAPAAIWLSPLFPDRLEELARLAADSSRTTHSSEQCLSACRYFALVLCGLFAGQDRAAVLAPDWEPLQRLRAIEPLEPAIDEVAAGSFRRKSPPQIQGTGHVVRCLEAALWAFAGGTDFRDAVLRAVNLGHDADTTGAVCGQLAGACWGEEGIPPSWRDGLARRDLIDAILARLTDARYAE